MIQKTRDVDVYRLPDSLAEDLDEFAAMVARFKAGEVSATQFQVFRVPQGVYEQRECGRFMLRIRLPAGVLLAHQMRRLGQVAGEHGNGVLHVTSRQDIQVHRVPLDSIHPALSALAEVGLSAKGGGGNTVRNITACPGAGVCPDEVFDVTGHVVALTEFLLGDPLSFQLPRKYKIAFSGCAKDCAGATVNDLGLIAARRDGADGFAAYVAGGMGARSRVADALEQFIPAPDVPIAAEAVKRVFDKHGDRKNRHKARLRFLVQRLGLEAFLDLYRQELDALRAAPPPGPAPRPVPHPAPGAEPAPRSGARSEDFDAWREANVTSQKQGGYHVVEIPLVLGDIQAEKLRGLADVVEACGEKMLRTTQSQNAVIRWVREEELADLHENLGRLGLASARPGVLRNMVACAGASTCRLGICLSRGLANAVTDALAGSDIDLRSLGDLKIHISGCPNACGRHPIGQIGLFGSVRRVKGRLVPHYVVQLGGIVEEGKTELAQGRQAVPARHLPAFVTKLLRAFEGSAECPDFAGFLAAGGRDAAEELAAGYKDIPDFEEDKDFYFDWGAEAVFSLAGRGAGECGAGVFDPKHPRFPYP